MTPELAKARLVVGHKLQFRDAAMTDAAFILKLRTDAEKSRHLSAVSGSLDAQASWLQSYADGRDQAYFVIEDRQARSVGTVRLYDPQGDSFCWGSWIKDDSAPSSFAIESALMVYHYARHCGFKRSHFDVRIDNDRVWGFHERLGARRVKTTELDHHYEMDEPVITALLESMRRWLPQGIQVTA
jgi:RimJ/RimL family protein N-acetyltransferase